MAAITETKGREFSHLEQRLKYAEESVVAGMSNPLMMWDSGPSEASKHFNVIDEILSLMESLKNLPPEREFGNPIRLLRRAKGLLQTAMSRLEEELVRILEHHKQYFEPKYTSFRSCRLDVVYDESFVSNEVETSTQEEASQRECTTEVEPKDHLVDLIHPNAVSHLKSIAKMMFASDYGLEFCKAFVKARKEALDEYWTSLEMDTFSIEDVLKMDWERLNYEIKKWNQMMKIIIRVYLPSEKRLCNQILEKLGPLGPYWFVEISKFSMVNLLNFGEAVAMGDHRPEKLIQLLDMYEVVAGLLLDIDNLLSEDVGYYVRIKFHELLGKLGDCSRATLVEFRRTIASNMSTTPFPGGGIHPLTTYVMNYIRSVAEYVETLNVLLKDQDQGQEQEHYQEVGDFKLIFETHDHSEELTSCPAAYHFRSITSILESNLNNSSRLYRDGALQLVFLMNNINYIVQTVKGSKLGPFFGDAWIRERIARIQQQATGYVRLSWSSALSFLNPLDDHALSRPTLKESCRNFNIAFEEVYRNQTGWCVLNPQLKEDLQISISQMLIPAYRSFIGRYANHITNIKYTIEDLESLLLDLFEGSPRSLPKKKTRPK